jgi:hypothetical protein
MPTRVATAVAEGPVAAAARTLADEIRMQLGGAAPTLAIVVAPAGAPLHELEHALDVALPGSLVVGTAGVAFTERGAAGTAAIVFALAGDVQVFAADRRGELPREARGYPHAAALALGPGEDPPRIAVFAKQPFGRGVEAGGGPERARLAAKRARAEIGGADVAGALVFGCDPLALASIREELVCAPIAGITGAGAATVLAFPR